VKSKIRTQQTLERVNQLKTENEMLEEKIRMLTKELGFLKDLFLAHAGRWMCDEQWITFLFIYAYSLFVSCLQIWALLNFLNSAL
jgi:hypothetical protein